ncbi:PIG-L family deacetylase [Virgibacillus dokdonensis]|uniref:PIG-L family deacetylase n=1 Tax=Virgibacillus dokdonensis TaxID=302167 RepID=A0ABU7VG74_9BACI
MNVLVFSAHPDDEVIGVGGTIAKHVERGDTVNVVIIAEGKSSRYDIYEKPEDQVLKESYLETKKACEKLGVSKFKRLNFPDNRLDSYQLLEIVKVVENNIEEFNPNIVYTQYGGDINIDHAVVHRAVMTATRPLPNHNVKWVFTYETLSSTEWNYNVKDSFIPNYFVNIENQLTKKIEAMSYYKSELREYPHPRSLNAIQHNAKVWGAKVGVYAAEAFRLVRGLWIEDKTS